MKVYKSTKGTIYVYCPHCGLINLTPWTFNGDFENPTFSPSVLTTLREPKRICHSYIRNGKWEFLADSTHSDAGKTVDMIEVPAWVQRDIV